MLGTLIFGGVVGLRGLRRARGPVRWSWFVRAIGVLALLCACARPASAQSSGGLSYERGAGAEDCPNRTQLLAAIAERAGSDPLLPSRKRTIVARIMRDGARLKGQVELLDEHGLPLGLREFKARASRCEELAQAMALSISIAIDPKRQGVAGESPSDRAPVETASVVEHRSDFDLSLPARAPFPTLKRRASTLDASMRDSEELWEPEDDDRGGALHWMAGAGVSELIAEEPDPTLSWLGFVAARRGRASLALELRAVPPSTHRVNGSTQARMARFAVGGVPCAHFGPLFTCGLALLGRVYASGAGPTDLHGAGWLVSLGARAGLAYEVFPRVEFRVRSELLTDFPRYGLSYQGADVWHTQLAYGGFGADAAFNF